MSRPSPVPSPNPAMASHRIDANRSIGALEIGAAIMICLFGMATVQTYNYYRRYPNDSRWLKFLVALVWCLEVGHVTSASSVIYAITVTQYEDPRPGRQLRIPTGLGLSVVLGGAIAPIVQTYLAHRIYVLSKKMYIPALCWVVALASFILNTLCGAAAFGGGTIVNFGNHWGSYITAVLGLGICVDGLLTISLCYYLRHDRATQFRRTVKLTDQLMKWTIETGLVTSVTAFIALILWVTVNRNFAWLGALFFVAETFANAFLAALNSREGHRAAPETVVNWPSTQYRHTTDSMPAPLVSTSPV
ncbi:hypothetical protein BV22DRAFT_233427 [Leucogyrophana mollusca]|uniref:Uncharacterized protein n=1 Tax=Leucogyrophana mollusca TaxID=85980 RepID=A0ACB8BQQ1_9AGAM|nr:hypothetical protein BV22DRAFT_233427 [Leucogyrophana mollusca]